ncbi:MAG: RCC1 domain-containing protein [Micrococcaceae bacterium]
MGTASNWKIVGAGGASSGAINNFSVLYTWGANSHGQLGLGHNDTVHYATRVSTGTKWQVVEDFATYNMQVRTTGNY